MNNKLYDKAKAIVDFCWDRNSTSEFRGLWKGASVISNSTEFIHLMYELYEAVEVYKTPPKFWVKVKTAFRQIVDWIFGWKIVIVKR